MTRRHDREGVEWCPCAPCSRLREYRHEHGIPSAASIREADRYERTEGRFAAWRDSPDPLALSEDVLARLWPDDVPVERTSQDMHVWSPRSYAGSVVLTRATAARIAVVLVPRGESIINARRWLAFERDDVESIRDALRTAWAVAQTEPVLA